MFGWALFKLEWGEGISQAYICKSDAHTKKTRGKKQPLHLHIIRFIFKGLQLKAFYHEGDIVLLVYNHALSSLSSQISICC